MYPCASFDQTFVFSGRSCRQSGREQGLLVRDRESCPRPQPRQRGLCTLNHCKSMLRPASKPGAKVSSIGLQQSRVHLDLSLVAGGSLTHSGSPLRRASRASAWWARQDSNLQPDRYERPALTIELQAPPRAGPAERGPRQRCGLGLQGEVRSGNAGQRLGSTQSGKPAKRGFQQELVGSWGWVKRRSRLMRLQRDDRRRPDQLAVDLRTIRSPRR